MHNSLQKCIKLSEDLIINVYKDLKNIKLTKQNLPSSLVFSKTGLLKGPVPTEVLAATWSSYKKNGCREDISKFRLFEASKILNSY